ncbi:MAG TPA: NHLP bacteriocin system secretion protein [Negativicutes bacterium]|nr:NHLP bacteriocin system secretion protein [Negativicutes bacterium]
MAQGLFRKVALDKLASPEQLDQLITVTNPKAWFALIAVGCILATAVIWSILGSIPTKVSGQGVIAKSSGVYNIVNDSSGQISDIRVAVGDQVKKGQVVARIDQPELVEQINELKTTLEKLKKLDGNGIGQSGGQDVGPELADLYDLNQKIKEAKAALPYAAADYKHDLQIAAISLEQAKVSESDKKLQLDQITALYQAGVVSESDFKNAQRDWELQRLAVQAAEEDLAKLTADQDRNKNLGQAQLSLQLLEEQFAATKAAKITETEDKIKELQDKLVFSSEIVTQVDGRVVEVNVNKGDMIGPGKYLFSLEREGSTITLEAVMYVPADKGKNILPGMEALISPSTVKKEEYGCIVGRVTAVSEYPATTQNMMHTLGDEGLVADLAGESASLEMHIDLTVDDSTESGFKWTSPQGPPVKIASGTLCSGSVTVSEERPLSMVIPMLKKAFSR